METIDFHTHQAIQKYPQTPSREVASKKFEWGDGIFLPMQQLRAVTPCPAGPVETVWGPGIQLLPSHPLLLPLGWL